MISSFPQDTAPHARASVLQLLSMKILKPNRYHYRLQDDPQAEAEALNILEFRAAVSEPYLVLAK